MRLEAMATMPVPAAICLVLVLATGCQKRADDAASVTADPAPSRAAVEPALVVDTARVRRGAMTQKIVAPASLVARRRARIGPEVSGLIRDVAVEEGDRVARGDLLFEIDAEPYELGYRRALAGLDRARAGRHQTETELARAAALHSQNVMADEVTDRLRSQLEAARAQEREAREAVALAQRNLDRTRVLAPFDGSITRRFLDEGTMALAQPQAVVIELQETVELDAVASIPEVHFAAVSVGDAARLFVDGMAAPIEVRVSAVGDSVDSRTHTYRVKMRVPNPEHRLKAGIFARTEIRPRAHEDALLLPRSALRSEDGRSFVLALERGRTRLVPVEIGLVSEQEVELISGLDEGAEVLVGRSARELAPGMRVRAEQPKDVGLRRGAEAGEPPS